MIRKTGDALSVKETEFGLTKTMSNHAKFAQPLSLIVLNATSEDFVRFVKKGISQTF